MKRKYITYGVLIMFAMIGYNAFLVQRDQKMFDAYYHHHSTQQQ